MKITLSKKTDHDGLFYYIRRDGELIAVTSDEVRARKAYAMAIRNNGIEPKEEIIDEYDGFPEQKAQEIRQEIRDDLRHDAYEMRKKYQDD